ncbi:MAG: tetratricopeptide repeat protein, partial [Nonomuraea sp.]|nr:tetratricopeptide repeat protein [Nonomuraea sp.]
AHRGSVAASLPPEQRILVPGASNTLRIANGLAEFVRDALDGPLTLVADHLDAADPTDAEFVEVLRRRVPSVTVVEGERGSAGGPYDGDFGWLRDQGFHHAMAESGLAALEKDPENWPLVSRTAAALAAIDREDEAWELYRSTRLTCTDPKYRATFACALATILVRHHDPAGRDPHEALGWINEAITITALLPDRRLRAFHLGFDVNTKALIEVRLGHFARAAELVDEAVALAENDLGDEHPIHRMVLYANRAQLAAMSGDHERALADYARAIALDPGYPDYYLDRGNLLVKLGRQDEALADYETMMRVSPPFPEPYYNRAGIRFARGDLDGALADLDYALELDPAFAPAYANRAGLHAALGQLAEARADVERGLALDRRNAHLHSVLGQVELAEGRPTEARKSLDTALELQPDLAQAWAARGALAFEEGDPEGAVSDLTRALELGSTAELLFNRAVALRACGRPQEAAADLRAAAELDPGDEDIRTALAEG